MNCGEIALEAVPELRLRVADGDRGVCAQWDGECWRVWCSAFCAAHGRHLQKVTVLPGGGYEVETT